MADKPDKPARKVKVWDRGIANRGTRDAPEWYARFTDIDGKQKTIHTHQSSKELARRFLVDIKARVARGERGIAKLTIDEKRQRTMTVAALIEHFLEAYSRPKIKDLDTYRLNARSIYNRRIKPFPIADKAVVEVRPVDVRALLVRLQEAGYSGAGANAALRVLSRAIVWATNEEIIPQIRNPVSGVELARTSPAEEHFSLDEVHRLLSLPELPAMVWCALFTGMRKGELYGLTWPAVRLDGNLPRIEVRRSYRTTPKSDKPRTIPIHPDLLPVLRAWQEKCPATPEALVFPVLLRSHGGRRIGWRMGGNEDMGGLPDLLQAAGCHIPQERSARPGRAPRERVWHTLRHTFATLFMEASGDGYALSIIMGHSTGGGMATMTAGYTHARLDYLARELGKLDILPRAAGVVNIRARPRRKPAR